MNDLAKVVNGVMVNMGHMGLGHLPKPEWLIRMQEQAREQEQKEQIKANLPQGGGVKNE